MELGVVGCGFFAQNHLHAWTHLKSRDAHIAAVCDVDPAKAKAFQVRQHWCSDAEAMFRNRRLDLADILTRVDTH
ncbi:MAG TPA: Gfo/Idh/MocA family oxidoreductase [Dongiaceae bacterium]|nr:Gfo/Idh/MocA family oxidoreductase [Dongiaceae bacterium]